MRVTSQLLVTVVEDSKNGLFRLDGTYYADGPKQASNGRAVVAAGDTFEVPFGSVVTGEGFCLQASADCDVTLNGETELQLRRPYVTASERAPVARMYFEGNVSSISVEVLGTSPAIVTFGVWGDSA